MRDLKKILKAKKILMKKLKDKEEFLLNKILDLI